MRIFVEFEVHDYMDMYPRSSFSAMEESEAQGFADYMNKNYSGGTTRLVRVLTKEEATQHVLNEIKDVINLIKKLYEELKDIPAEDLQKEFIGKLAEIIHNENPKKDS